MKHLSKLGLALLLLGIAFACKQAEAEDNAATEMNVAADTTAVTTTSSNPAVENKESNRKFVRTADLKFKVKNVAKSTYAIENIVSKHGGFVTFTDLKSTVNEHDETQVSQDSSSSRYDVCCRMCPVVARRCLFLYSPPRLSYWANRESPKQLSSCCYSTLLHTVRCVCLCCVGRVGVDVRVSAAVAVCVGVSPVPSSLSLVPECPAAALL